MSRKYVNFDVEDNIGKYFKDVRKSIILTPSEEIRLAERIREGDEKAVELLVNANLKFVISVAKEYQNQGLPLSDLISEGNYGLIKAAKRFDHEKGFRFISYAVWWIRQSILQSLNDNARMVRLPANIINKITYLNKEISKFEFINEREPVYGEIFDKDKEAMDLIYYPKCLSLNETINEDGDELIELIPNLDEDEVENKTEVDFKVKNELQKTLSILDDREKEIIENYFGINTDLEPMTLEAIGEKYDLTKERIRQIKNKALMKLRYNSNKLFDLIND
jgi:RNA polymerase primary sigma factor